MLRTLLIALVMVVSIAANGLVPPDLSASNFVLTGADDVCDGDVVILGAYDASGTFYFMSKTAKKSKLMGVALNDVGEEVPEDLLWVVQSTDAGYSLLTKDLQNGVCGGHEDKENSTDLALVTPAKATIWTLTASGDDGIVLRDTKTTNRYLGIYGYGDESAYFGFYTESGADNIVLNLYRYQDPTQASSFSVLFEGVLRLTGTWTAEELSNLSFDGVGALDMQSVRLPLDAKPFAHYPENENIPIYVSASQKGRIPAAWDFVVCGGQLQKNVVLKDARPLLLPYPISVEASQMSYKRQMYGDGGWETLVLPFDADVPKGVEALRLKEIDGENAVFVPTNNISAGEPVLIRPEKDSEKSENFEFFSQKNKISSLENSGATFCGTLLGFKLAEDSENIYMLSSDGEAFSRALAGSTLYPFRAYLHLSSIHESLRIFMPTDISSARLSADSNGDVFYDLKGRRTKKDSRGIRVGRNGKWLSL